MDEARIEAIFHHCDSNGDGFLSKEEICQGLRHLQIPYSKASVDRFMQLVDTNSDGFVSLDEFRVAVKQQQTRLVRAFRELDHGGDNSISARDLERWGSMMGHVLSHDELKRLVDHIDRNGNGTVELQEFCEYFLTHVGDAHTEGLFEAWLKGSNISAIPIPDATADGVPSWITLTSGAIAGMVSRTLTAPADRIKTLLQASVGHAAAAARADVASAAAPSGAAHPPAWLHQSRAAIAQHQRFRQGGWGSSLAGGSNGGGGGVAVGAYGGVHHHTHYAPAWPGPRYDPLSAYASQSAQREAAHAGTSTGAHAGRRAGSSIMSSLAYAPRSMRTGGGGGGVQPQVPSWYLASQAAASSATRLAADVAGSAASMPAHLSARRPAASSCLPLRHATGGGSGGASAMAAASAGVGKVPLQVAGIRQGIAIIMADGGLSGFWRGNGINVIKVMPETALRFWTYEQLKPLLCEDPNNISLHERFLAGAGAGVVTQSIIYPLEVAKTRFALSARGQYKSLAHCLQSTARAEGVRGLYKGLGASVMGIIPYSGVDLGLYSLLKDTYRARYNNSEPSVLTLLACGATATTVAQVVSYPLQLVRTRLQAQGMAGRPVMYNGISHCVHSIIAADGLRGLYRGIGPNFVKSVPAMTISYGTYEAMKRVLMFLRDAGEMQGMLI